MRREEEAKSETIQSKIQPTFIVLSPDRVLMKSYRIMKTVTKNPSTYDTAISFSGLSPST